MSNNYHVILAVTILRLNGNVTHVLKLVISGILGNYHTFVNFF